MKSRKAESPCDHRLTCAPRKSGIGHVLCLLLTLGVVLSSHMADAQSLPAGIALPVMVETELKSDDKPGDKIEGKLMQELRLPSGSTIKSGSHVVGHVVSTNGAAGGAQIVVQFDQLQDEHQTMPLNVSLRALAATENVFQAKLPVDASSTYESSDEWVTKQVGGEYVFRGRGYVASDKGPDQGKVGIWSGSGVWGKLNPAADCPASDSNGEQQALWIFSTTACGVYGIEDTKITHAGRTAPLGQITLGSAKNILVRGGSGWLLIVNPVTAK
jgi:hypothetical protein